jgi:hypothetical protein
MIQDTFENMFIGGFVLTIVFLVVIAMVHKDISDGGICENKVVEQQYTDGKKFRLNILMY